MADNNKPKDLIELFLSLNNIPRDMYDLAKSRAVVDFNDGANKTVNVDSLAGTELKADNYKLEGDKKKILQGAEIMGQELIAHAKKLGMKITDLKEFKNADLNKDGTVDAKEVGALLLASSTFGASQFKEDGKTFSRLNDISIGQDGKLTSTFDNKLTPAEMKQMLDPKTAELAKEMAKKLLVDNGVKIADAKDGPALAEMARNTEKVPQMRC